MQRVTNYELLKVACKDEQTLEALREVGRAVEKLCAHTQLVLPVCGDLHATVHSTAVNTRLNAPVLTLCISLDESTGEDVWKRMRKQMRELGESDKLFERPGLSKKL